jgi:hypothetical protein
MTTTEEMMRAIDSAYSFLLDLMNPGKTPRVPKEIRQRARRVSKHFPFNHEYLLLHTAELQHNRLVDEIEVLQNTCDHLQTDRNCLADGIPRKYKIAMEVLESEQFAWLMAGSNHVSLNIHEIRPAYEAWKEAGGKGFFSKEQDAKG